jgi:hypothetical protein
MDIIFAGSAISTFSWSRGKRPSRAPKLLFEKNE